MRRLFEMQSREHLKIGIWLENTGWLQIYRIDIDVNFDNDLTDLAKILSNQEKTLLGGGT